MDLLEYYHMADKLVVSNNPNLQFRGWLAIAKILKNVRVLYLGSFQIYNIYFHTLKKIDNYSK
jgi:hypothetical protein